MSKAAAQRRAKRMKLLSELAKNSPDVFEREWDKRIRSWMTTIDNRAGKLRDRYDNQVQPVFEIVDEAIEILRSCGELSFRKHAASTYEALTDKCCTQFATHVDPRLSRTNNFQQLEEMAIYHVR